MSRRATLMFQKAGKNLGQKLFPSRLYKSTETW